MCAAVDVHYPSTGGARAAAVLAADAAFAHVLAERTAVVPRVAPYRPGEFYLRELPPLRAVLEDLSELGLLVVDGYADLDPDGRPGLGARAHAESGIPVIGRRSRPASSACPSSQPSRPGRLAPRSSSKPVGTTAPAPEPRRQHGPISMCRLPQPRQFLCAGCHNHANMVCRLPQPHQLSLGPVGLKGHE
jgi:deoxyribonuclease V